MKTATKNALAEAQIRALFRRHFPNEAVARILPLKGGTFNTLYQAWGTGALQNGVVLKTAPAAVLDLPTHEREILRTEVAAYRMLEGADVPVPRILAVDFSRTLLPCDCFIMTRMPGRSWYDSCPRPDPALSRQLGRYVARIHSVKGSHFGELSGRQYPRWSAAFSAMIDDALADNGRQGRRLPYEAIRRAVSSRMALLDSVHTPVLVNFDLWAGNVFLKKKPRPVITGILDFERSFFGDPLATFVSTLLIYEDVEREPDFLAGYGEAAGGAPAFTPEERERMRLYELLMYLRAYAETQRYPPLLRAAERVGIRAILHALLRTFCIKGA